MGYILATVLVTVLAFLLGAERTLPIKSHSWPLALGIGFLGMGRCLVVLHKVSADSECGGFTIQPSSHGLENAADNFIS